MKVVVTGSLGHISQPLAVALIQKGYPVTVISSNPHKQKEIEALGATAAIGSLEDVNFLAVAFAGADALYAMVPPNYAQTDQIAYYQGIGNNYATAIQQCGIQRVVHLSSYGAHLSKGTGYILGSHHTENILNQLPDVALTHLRAGFFYYNLYNFIGMIKQLGFIGANYGGNDKIITVAPTDIAAAAAEAIEAPVTGRHVRNVASDERTANDIASVLGAAIGKPGLPWMTFTDEQMKQSMEQRGVPAHIIHYAVELGAAVHSGAIYELHEPMAMGKVKAEDFAREFAAAFKKG